jgi:2-phosphosulfolactate phosphatase
MKINVLLTPSNLDELSFSGKTTVIIDVLRATSTIVSALNNGAKEIIPVASVEFAVKVSGGMFGGLTLLGGERNTKKIEGFALGNSPLEYSSRLVKGKSIILFTTNGTKAVVKAKFSKNLYICSFLNLSAVADHINSMDTDIEILCAGRNNSFSLEDTVCAGKLISEILKNKKDLELSDTAQASIVLNKSFGKNLFKMLCETEHGKLLLENGFEEDIKFCSKLNTIHAIPCFSGNVVKLLVRE